MTTAPRTAAHLPGYTFVGHGFQFFGSVKAPVDLYSKRGNLTAEVTRWDKQQQAAHGDDAIGAVDGVLRERLVAYVRQVAEEKNDLEVYLLIDAYLAGHTKRSELAEHAGLTLSQYGAAKKRLRTLLLQAPPDLLAVMEHAS